MRALITILALAAATAAAADAPGTQRPLSPLQQRGKQVFDVKCLPCHGPGVWGTNALARRMDPRKAQLTARTDLTVPMVRTLIRSGIGSMPPIRKTEVTDPDADAIAAYLTRNSAP